MNNAGTKGCPLTTLSFCEMRRKIRRRRRNEASKELEELITFLFVLISCEDYLSVDTDEEGMLKN